LSAKRIPRLSFWASVLYFNYDIDTADAPELCTAGTTAPENQYIWRLENQYIWRLENQFIKDCAEVQKELGIGYLKKFFVPLAYTEI
jgi:hypothetical protein